MAPAWIAAQAEPADALKSGARTTTGGASLLQRGLVELQAALSLVLLVAAGLFSLSLNKLQSTDLKLETKKRFVVTNLYAIENEVPATDLDQISVIPSTT
jgi:hypothetical protein